MKNQPTRGGSMPRERRNEMKKYLIKATITNGENEETVLLRKGGHSVDNINRLSEVDFYKTKATAKATATKWNKKKETHEQMDPIHSETIEYEATEL